MNNTLPQTSKGTPVMEDNLFITVTSVVVAYFLFGMWILATT